jgi:hypothetical protein
MADATNSGLGAEIRDLIRNVVKDDMPTAGGLRAEIAALFKGIGIQEGEEIQEWRGYSIENVLP